MTVKPRSPEEIKHMFGEEEVKENWKTRVFTRISIPWSQGFGGGEVGNDKVT